MLDLQRGVQRLNREPVQVAHFDKHHFSGKCKQGERRRGRCMYDDESKSRSVIECAPGCTRLGGVPKVVPSVRMLAFARA